MECTSACSSGFAAAFRTSLCDACAAYLLLFSKTRVNSTSYSGAGGSRFRGPMAPLSQGAEPYLFVQSVNCVLPLFFKHRTPQLVGNSWHASHSRETYAATLQGTLVPFHHRPYVDALSFTCVFTEQMFREHTRVLRRFGFRQAENETAETGYCFYIASRSVVRNTGGCDADAPLSGRIRGTRTLRIPLHMFSNG